MLGEHINYGGGWKFRTHTIWAPKSSWLQLSWLKNRTCESKQWIKLTSVKLNWWIELTTIELVNQADYSRAGELSSSKLNLRIKIALQGHRMYYQEYITSWGVLVLCSGLNYMYTIIHCTATYTYHNNIIRGNFCLCMLLLKSFSVNFLNVRMYIHTIGPPTTSWRVARTVGEIKFLHKKKGPFGNIFSQQKFVILNPLGVGSLIWTYLVLLFSLQPLDDLFTGVRVYIEPGVKNADELKRYFITWVLKEWGTCMLYKSVSHFS